MNETFEKLRPEYVQLLSSMKITQGSEALAVAGKLLKSKAAYVAVSSKTGVPVAWLMAVNERESGGRLDTYLGNGDPLSERTRHVPRGRGPFPNWTAGAADALDYDHISGIADWSWPRACFEGELWNGFGYRLHGRHSAYLWAGTSVYQGGKFGEDDVWSPHEWDTQLGIVPVMAALIRLDPSLQFPGGIPDATALPPMAAPSELAGGPHGVNWVQDVLNHVMDVGLSVDGSFGRKTRAALKDFQAAHGLTVDGLVGPETTAALENALEASKAPPAAPVALAEAANDNRAPQGLFGSVDASARTMVAGYAPLSLLGEAESDTPIKIFPDGSILPLYPVYDHDCALLCQGIYGYPGDPSIAWDHYDPGDDDGVCWAIKQIGDISVVVLRGSTTLEDWVDDVEAVAEAIPDEPIIGRVHRGFAFGLGLVAGEILARAPKHILLTGHSLGAARASILSGILKNGGRPPLARVMFGEPRPGYVALANYVKDIPGRNYRNGRGIRGDLITGLPFSTSWMPWVSSMPFTEVNALPPDSDPWGPFSWHHIQLYAAALSTLNTGTTP